MFGHEFRMLIQEARLTQASLLSGLEFLRKADYDQPGTSYAAFFQLSIGLERLFKLVIILDHKARHALQNPTDRQLRAVGHELAGVTKPAERSRTRKARRYRSGSRPTIEKGGCWG